VEAAGVERDPQVVPKVPQARGQHGGRRQYGGQVGVGALVQAPVGVGVPRRGHLLPAVVAIGFGAEAAHEARKEVVLVVDLLVYADHVGVVGVGSRIRRGYEVVGGARDVWRGNVAGNLDPHRVHASRRNGVVGKWLPQVRRPRQCGGGRVVDGGGRG